MARDPHTQREDERAREDDDDARTRELERADRAIDKGSLQTHLEVLADALRAPGNRVYRCRDCPTALTSVVVKPEMIGDGRAYIYPIGDGPFCARCGTLMERVYRPGDEVRRS